MTVQNETPEQEQNEENRSWRGTYLLVMTVLAIQIVLYYLFTITFS